MAAHEQKWYVAKNNQRLGPFNLVELRDLMARGELRLSDLVWETGTPQWVLASAVPGLASPPPSPEPDLLAAGPPSGPPPLPKPSVAAAEIQAVGPTSPPGAGSPGGAPEGPPASKNKAGLFVLGVVLTVAGLFVFFVPHLNAWSRSRLGTQLSETPEEITLEKLRVRGLTGNPHVVVTDFAFNDNLVVVKRLGSWETVWIPIRPRGEPQGKSFRVIVKGPKVHNEEDLRVLTSRDKIHGLIINAFTSLSGKEKTVLQENYPGTDFDQVQILEPDRRPPRVGDAGWWYLAGAVITLGGGALGYWAGWRNFKRYLGEQLAQKKK